MALEEVRLKYITFLFIFVNVALLGEPASRLKVGLEWSFACMLLLSETGFVDQYTFPWISILIFYDVTIGERGGFRGGRGGGRGYFEPQGPPAQVVEAGVFEHPCEGEAVCKLTNAMIPYFNAPIYLDNKTQIGKVEEVFGPINSVYFTIKMSDGVVATSYSGGDKFFIDPAKLLPLERFLPKPKGAPRSSRGGGRGGRGGGRGRGGVGGGRGGVGGGGR